VPDVLHQLDELYTSERDGSDECGDGTEQKPYKTILQVLVSCVSSIMD